VARIQASFTNGETVQSVLILSQYLINCTFRLISRACSP